MCQLGKCFRCNRRPRCRHDHHHCKFCCDSCSELRTTWRLPCGGYNSQCINPYKGYTIYQTQCACNQSLGATTQMIYLKYITPYNQGQSQFLNGNGLDYQCPCQCHAYPVQKRGWLGNVLNFYRTPNRC